MEGVPTQAQACVKWKVGTASGGDDWESGGLLQVPIQDNCISVTG